MIIRKLFNKPIHLTSGLYHYKREGDGFKSRVHLRIDPDGHGTLIINANQVTHLNLSAALMAYLVLEGTNESEAIRSIKNAFKVSQDQALSDFIHFNETLEDLIHPNFCPVCSIEDLEISAPFSSRPSAPYRMDLALTYRCNNDCAHCYNGRSRNFPELSTEKWKGILDHLWDLGIPHIVFTGGEPTLRDDLPELVAHAEKNGQITGLNTNARRLSDKTFLSSLLKSGLDHVQITVESHNHEVHDKMVSRKGAWQQTITGLRNVLDSPLYAMTNTTMLRSNCSDLGATLDFLAEEGVPTIGLNALIYSGKGLNVGTGLLETELPPLLDLARNKTSKNNQRLIWYTPTQYCQFDPTQLELGVKGCTAALYNMCVESDGGVIPCQSYYQQLGNIINDSWDSIWNHPLSKRLRDRDYVEEECRDCLLLPECGGGCPLAMQALDRNLIAIDHIPLSQEPELLIPNS